MFCNFGLFDAYSLSFGSNVATTDYLKPNTFSLMSIFLRAFFGCPFCMLFQKPCHSTAYTVYCLLRRLKIEQDLQNILSKAPRTTLATNEIFATVKPY